jgi:integrase
MTLYRRGRVWQYDFWFQNERFRASTHTTSRADAEWIENELKRQLAFRAAGVETPGGGRTPRFQDWAEVFFEHRQRKLKPPRGPARLKDLVRVVLRFWGAKPPPRERFGPVEGEPYHDLRLGDVVADPYWIERFEQWMDARRIGPKSRPMSNQTKKHYLSTVSMMFRVASAPKFRKHTNVTTNPFAGVERPQTHGRTVTLEVDELRRLLDHASYHVRLALAIGALAPKLRLANILGLRWRDHLDAALARITIHSHKTDGTLGAPLVVPVTPQLHAILEDAHARAGSSEWVVNYRGRPIGQIRGGVRGAAERAGLAYGLLVGGLTFHTVRHSMATMLAEIGEPERMRMEVMGHTRHSTTQRYTHLRPRHQIPALERLSGAVSIGDIVTKPGMRAVGKSAGRRSATVARFRAKSPDTPDQPRGENPQKQAVKPTS